MAITRTRPYIPPLTATSLRLALEAIRNIFLLRLDAVGELTLTPNVASTAVADIRVTVNSAVVLTPVTASAATELGNGTAYVTVANESFTVTHANNATADRTFRYIVMG